MPSFCRTLNGKKCGVCAKICPVKAIDFEMKDTIVTEKVGAIIAATGYDLFDQSAYGEYGAGRYPDVISGLQYERILSASGPFGGHIQRPSDGKEPKDIVFISCVGSRDASVGRPYCSGICCMYIAKQAILTKRPHARFQFIRFLHGHPCSREKLRRVRSPGPGRIRRAIHSRQGGQDLSARGQDGGPGRGYAAGGPGGSRGRPRGAGDRRRVFRWSWPACGKTSHLLRPVRLLTWKATPSFAPSKPIPPGSISPEHARAPRISLLR